MPATTARDMANMFKTIETQGGGSGLPEWLSDHPDPGNRYEYISREAQTLRVADPVHDTRGFGQAQARLKEMSPAPTTAEAVRNAENRPRESSGTTTLGRVEPPSNRFVTCRAGTLFQVSVPDNWRQLPGSRASRSRLKEATLHLIAKASLHTVLRPERRQLAHAICKARQRRFLPRLRKRIPVCSDHRTPRQPTSAIGAEFASSSRTDPR